MSNERGFTLIELMVVLVIVGILSAIAVPAMSKQVDKAKIKRAVLELQSMKTILNTHLYDPLANPECKVPADVAGAKTVLESYGVTNLKDPWSRNYLYKKVTDTSYLLYSKGPSEGAGDEISVTESANPKENDTQTEGASFP